MPDHFLTYFYLVTMALHVVLPFQLHFSFSISFFLFMKTCFYIKIIALKKEKKKKKNLS